VSVLAVVAAGRGDALSVVECSLCLLELPGFDECRAQARVEPPEGRIVAWKERDRAVEEVRRRDIVAAVMRGVPGRLEVCRCPERERGGLGIDRPEFGAVADRLFEVISRDLRAPGEGVRGDGLEPVGVAVMELGAKGLGIAL
jgi:hypothetical protein